MDNGKNGNCGILSVHVIMHTKTTRDKLSVSAVYSGNRARETHKPLASIGNCFKPEGRCDSQSATEDFSFFFNFQNASKILGL